MSDVVEYQNGNLALSIIDNVNMNAIENKIQSIDKFQRLVKDKLHQGHDYGIVPGTTKPTLLKPGAEKILMLLGLRSEFDVIDSTRDFDNGFFQYQVKCKLLSGDMVITEGLGACNTKEKKYISQDPFSIDNTVLKMAKKRALVDGTLLVGSLSDIFTQDLEDIDLNGNKTGTSNLSHDDNRLITKAQAKRIFAISNGNAELCTKVLSKYGYKKSDEVKRIDYDKICVEVEAETKGTNNGNIANEEGLPWNNK